MARMKFILCDEYGMWREEDCDIDIEPLPEGATRADYCLWIDRAEIIVQLGQHHQSWPTHKDVWCLCVGEVEEGDLNATKTPFA